MTMTAREAMQALLDGKIVYRRDDDDPERIYEFKLSEKGYIVEWFKDDWVLSHIPLNDLVGITEEYSLNFEQALHAMLGGKIVISDLNPNLKQRFHDGCFEYNGDDAEWRDSYFPIVEQKSRWKVVE